MDRWALERAVRMLEARAEEGHLSAEAEQRAREHLAAGDARRALESLTGRAEFEVVDEEFDDGD